MFSPSFDCQNLMFSGHALQRMFFRGISEPEVASTIVHGEVIEGYPDDQPYPSVLIFDFVRGLPLHVVVSRDSASGNCTVVTAYVPDKIQWAANFKTRR
jgi:Domain of unknown function (DUF4258)